MKIIYFFLAFSTLSWSQNNDSKDLLSEAAPCIFQLTIERLTSDHLIFKCSEAFENNPFGIQDFKIKFRGYPTIHVQDTVLDFKSKQLACSLSVGDYVTIFDIENLIVENKKVQKFKTLSIQIIE
ncbi:MAG: hypothetical protein ACSHXF_13420 [Aquaticitalea sp.]